MSKEALSLSVFFFFKDYWIYLGGKDLYISPRDPQVIKIIFG